MCMPELKVAAYMRIKLSNIGPVLPTDLKLIKATQKENNDNLNI